MSKKITPTKEFQIARDKTAYSKYLIDPAMSEFRILMNERKYSAKEIGITYRVIDNWHETEILPDGINDKGWKEFSVVELTWLSIVKSLRKFGFPLQKILETKESILIWDKETNSYPLIEYHIYKAWMSADDQYVLVLDNGKADVGSMEDIEKAKFWHGQMNMLLISVKSILKEMGHDVTLGRLILPPDKDEQEVLDIIRSSRSPIDFKKLTGYSGDKLKMIENLFQNESITKEIRIRPRNGKIDDVEITETYPINPPLEKINKDIQDSGEFAEVSVKIEKGVKQSATVKSKRSFKN